MQFLFHLMERTVLKSKYSNPNMNIEVFEHFLIQLFLAFIKLTHKLENL